MFEGCNVHRKQTGSNHQISSDENFNIVYPYGATLLLKKPAVAILSSGLMAHPVRQPVGMTLQTLIPFTVDMLVTLVSFSLLTIKDLHPSYTDIYYSLLWSFTRKSMKTSRFDHY